MQQSQSTRPFQGKASGRRYRSKRYSSISQRWVDRREQAVAAQLLDASSGCCNGHVIDMPCGFGRFYPLLQANRLRVSALDQSAAMVNLYRENDGFDDDRDHAEQADILQYLPEAAAPAGRALCIRLFQHLHHRELRVAALRTLAGNRRRIVMTYYDQGCVHYWTKRLEMWLKGRPVRVKMISRACFDAEVAEAGLRVVKRTKLLPGIHAQTWVLLAPIDDA